MEGKEKVHVSAVIIRRELPRNLDSALIKPLVHIPWTPTAQLHLQQSRRWEARGWLLLVRNAERSMSWECRAQTSHLSDWGTAGTSEAMWSSLSLLSDQSIRWKKSCKRVLIINCLISELCFLSQHLAYTAKWHKTKELLHSALCFRKKRYTLGKQVAEKIWIKYGMHLNHNSYKKNF